MSQKDLLNNLNFAKPIVVTQSDDTPIESTIVDTQGNANLTFVILLGLLTTAVATYAVTVDHGDDPALGDAENVDDDGLIGGLANAGFDGDDDDSVRKLGYKMSKRYVRLTITPTGNVAPASVTIAPVLGHPSLAPTDNPPVV